MGTRDWGLGTGDWGLGTGNWGLGTRESMGARREVGVSLSPLVST
ncbi:MAG: hypothetical protein V7L11_11090 [Nostoc sp.]